MYFKMFFIVIYIAYDRLKVYEENSTLSQYTS